MDKIVGGLVGLMMQDASYDTKKIKMSCFMFPFYKNIKLARNFYHLSDIFILSAVRKKGIDILICLKNCLQSLAIRHFSLQIFCLGKKLFSCKIFNTFLYR